MINTNFTKPELLAPAGSIEAFHTAIDAGADAIYLGLSDFNARLRAKNFTSKTLSYLVPFAHTKNVKIYVTLNIQLKQTDLEQVIHVLYQLEQIGVDAIIVADPGVIEIARTHFPKLTLHGSTQMAVHNSAGVQMAEKLGIKRVVLARELSINEISSIKKSTHIELETFVHGALCYSISGNCLASSILGGASGNRGRCTQVCRRKFTTSSTSGYFFSPKDFCAIDHLHFYVSTGISCLKIEGRMKGAEYVYTVVKAYRDAIDNKISTAEAKDKLLLDMGRSKTTLFLTNNNIETIIDPCLLPGTGQLLGMIQSISANSFTIISAEKLEQGDRLRIQPENGFEGTSVNILSVHTKNQEIVIEIKDSNGVSEGDSVYLISRKSVSAKLNQNVKINSSPVQFRDHYSRANAIIQKYQPKVKTEAKYELWFKINDLRWLEYLQDTSCQHLIFSGPQSQMLSLISNESILQKWCSRLYPALPPFIAEDEICNWKSLINQFREKSVTKWACANIGQVSLFQADTELVADNPIWALNYAAQSVLLKNGFKWFTYSMEDDYLNIRSIPSEKGIVYLYGHVPLFISRITPPVATGVKLSDPHKNSFYTSEKDGLHYLITSKPLCISQRKEKLAESGIRNFCIDLSFKNPNPSLLKQLTDAYKNGTKMPQSELFNFKAGLK
jgi:putative protease